MNDPEILDRTVEILVKEAREGSNIANEQLHTTLEKLFDKNTGSETDTEKQATIEYCIQKLVKEAYPEKIQNTVLEDSSIIYAAKIIPASRTDGGCFYLAGDTQFIYPV